jgi:hypothetical protein
MLLPVERQMSRSHASRLVVVLAAVIALLASASAPMRARAQNSTIPASLSDAEFWALSGRLSEANGVFVSRSGSPDNLLSNENSISYVAAELASRVRPGGVYLGVGPEQNFTYIAAMQPRMAFITDIRRGNLQLHLLYKALFGLSATRSELVARLFSRRAVPASTSKMTAAELMLAVDGAPAMTDAEYRANVTAIETYLTKTHALPLDKNDLDGIEYVADNFRRFGPDINYTSSINGRFGAFGSYGMIQSLTDGSGVGRTYLASDEAFTYVKNLEAKNVIVPIVGNFAGPKALRTIGRYLSEHGAVVGAFYVSNVEQYLERDGTWTTFCANVASLPIDAASIFIRPGGRDWFSAIADETRGCR